MRPSMKLIQFILLGTLNCCNIYPQIFQTSFFINACRSTDKDLERIRWKPKATNEHNKSNTKGSVARLHTTTEHEGEVNLKSQNLDICRNFLHSQLMRSKEIFAVRTEIMEL